VSNEIHARDSMKTAARAAIESHRDRLYDLSHVIHAHAELAFAEHESSQLIARALEEAGLRVQRGVGGLDTALLAEVGEGSLVVAICAEYDALPNIGHACGHNIIAAAAVGTAIGLVAAADGADMTVRVLGTPAEEVGNAGGKVLLLERGGFDGAHAVLMAHPAPANVLMSPFCAVSMFDVCYHGQASHAAAYPELGINAADALTVAQVAIGLLRQQLPANILIHGVVTRGGDAANIIPGETSARYMVRAPTLEALDDARQRVMRCFEAGATASGATLEIVGGDQPYAEVRHDTQLAGVFASNWQSLGHDFDEDQDLRPGGSTDLGNVSRVIPSIHPLLSIGAAPGVANHHPSFAAASVDPPADALIIDAAIALTWTAIDIATVPELRSRLLDAGSYQSSSTNQSTRSVKGGRS
jgi:amidohydrolase